VREKVKERRERGKRVGAHIHTRRIDCQLPNITTARILLLLATLVRECCGVCCSVLQCVAVCSALQRVAVCCGVLQVVAGCCSVWQRVAACCGALRQIANACCRILPLLARLEETERGKEEMRET